MPINEISIQLLQLLRRWSAGTVSKFSLEMKLDYETVKQAAQELLKQEFIRAYETGDPFRPDNQMLEIRSEGIAYLEEADNKLHY